MPATGGFGRIPAEAREKLLAGLDAVGGVFTMGYDTLTVTAARR